MITTKECELVYGIKLPFELNAYICDIANEINEKYNNVVSIASFDGKLMFGVIYKTIDLVYEINTPEMNAFTDEFMNKTNDNVNIFKMLFKRVKEVIEKTGNDNITLPDNLDFSWFIVNP